MKKGATSVDIRDFLRAMGPVPSSEVIARFGISRPTLIRQAGGLTQREERPPQHISLLASALPD